MKDLPIHLLLFLAITIPIVVLGAFYGEADDSRALRSIPRRLVMFILGCGVVAGVMLLCEHTFGSLG